MCSNLPPVSIVVLIQSVDVDLIGGSQVLARIHHRSISRRAKIKRHRRSWQLVIKITVRARLQSSIVQPINQVGVRLNRRPCVLQIRDQVRDLSRTQFARRGRGIPVPENSPWRSPHHLFPHQGLHFLIQNRRLQPLPCWIHPEACYVLHIEPARVCILDTQVFLQRTARSTEWHTRRDPLHRLRLISSRIHKHRCRWQPRKILRPPLSRQRNLVHRESCDVKLHVICVALHILRTYVRQILCQQCRFRIRRTSRPVRSLASLNLRRREFPRRQQCLP